MRWVLFSGVAVAALCGCSGGDPTASVVDAGPTQTVGCESDPRVMSYAPGLAVRDAAGDRAYQLSSASPSPPGTGTNTWTIQVVDGSGAPLPGLSLQAAAFMPDHGHGSSVVPAVTDQGGGSYAVGPLYFFMPGVWRVTLANADGGAQAGQYFFCVEG